MLRRDRLCGVLAFGTTVAIGCGGGNTVSTGTGGHGGGTSSSSASSTSSSSSSSSSSSGNTCPSQMGTVLALTKLDFGEGMNGEWKKVGFNIDGKVSTANSTDLCKPNSGAPTSVPYPDGDNGIDNSFGKNLLPTILSLDPTWVTDVNGSLQQGAFNVLLKMYCLPPTGDVPSMTTKLFVGTPLGMTPKFDGTDMWPVAPELLDNPMDPMSSSIVFANSSVMGSTFDSGTNQTFLITIPLTVQGMATSIKLTLYSARTTMTLSADRKTATGGMIGGVLNTEEFVSELKKVGYVLNLCNSLLAGLITQARQASDILHDGTQDPTKTCDGISIGITFEMASVQLGIVGPAAAVGMSCP